MEKVNYPPEKLFSPSKQNKPNYDHIILWMLANNDTCNWSIFSEKPIDIPIGTLSRHLNQLKYKGFVEKISRGYYKITSEGKKEFYELSSNKKKGRKVIYPPKIILKSGRNYDHWILWMVYNNNYCKRLDFLAEPLSINQSSLSKNLNLLIENGYLSNTDGKYQITQSGKSKYSKMLQKYDLDRQAILEEESKKIEDITNKTINFFTNFRIEDKEIQFRFLNIILKIEYEIVKPLLKDEEVYFKIILFLSINHPDNYPNFISSNDFSTKYKIKKTTLDYYIDQILEGTIYSTRFFKLVGPSGEEYYIHSGGKLERMLQIITENQINKSVYLNKLFSKTVERTPSLDVNLIINQILGEICKALFNSNLKDSLREFLPDYIKYLAYKVELKKELISTYNKMEGIIWQDMAQAFNSQLSENLKDQFEENIREIDTQLKINPEDSALYYSKMKILIYFNQYNDVLTLLDEMIESFPEKEIDLMMKKASIFRKKKNLEAGLNIIEGLIKKYPRNNDLLSYKAFWFQYLDRKEEALKIVQYLIDNEPNNGIYYDNYGEILMYFKEYDEALKKFLKTIVLSDDEWYIYQTYIKLGICYKAINELDLAVKNLIKGIEFLKKSSIDDDIKQKWLVIADLFLSEIE
ncbi:MAG: hypothetical protein ACTSPN_05370 [Promethearchaeota archaeon]